MPLRKPGQEASEEKKPPTKPWDQKGASPNPWEPDYLRLKHKRPGFRCRFVPLASIEQKQLQGWEICNPKDYGALTDKHANDTTGLGARIQRRELVLMEIPEEMAKQREVFMQQKTVQAKRAAKAPLKEQAAETNKELENVGAPPVQIFDESSENTNE